MMTQLFIAASIGCICGALFCIIGDVLTPDELNWEN